MSGRKILEFLHSADRISWQKTWNVSQSQVYVYKACAIIDNIFSYFDFMQSLSALKHFTQFF